MFIKENYKKLIDKLGIFYKKYQKSNNKEYYLKAHPWISKLENGDKIYFEDIENENIYKKFNILPEELTYNAFKQLAKPSLKYLQYLLNKDKPHYSVITQPLTDKNILDYVVDNKEYIIKELNVPSEYTKTSDLLEWFNQHIKQLTDEELKVFLEKFPIVKEERINNWVKITGKESELDFTKNIYEIINSKEAEAIHLLNIEPNQEYNFEISEDPAYDSEGNLTKYKRNYGITGTIKDYLNYRNTGDGASKGMRTAYRTPMLDLIKQGKVKANIIKAHSNKFGDCFDKCLKEFGVNTEEFNKILSQNPYYLIDSMEAEDKGQDLKIYSLKTDYLWEYIAKVNINIFIFNINGGIMAGYGMLDKCKNIMVYYDDHVINLPKKYYLNKCSDITHINADVNMLFNMSKEEIMRTVRKVKYDENSKIMSFEHYDEHSEQWERYIVNNEDNDIINIHKEYNSEFYPFGYNNRFIETFTEEDLGKCYYIDLIQAFKTCLNEYLADGFLDVWCSLALYQWTEIYDEDLCWFSSDKYFIYSSYAKYKDIKNRDVNIKAVYRWLKKNPVRNIELEDYKKTLGKLIKWCNYKYSETLTDIYYNDVKAMSKHDSLCFHVHIILTLIKKLLNSIDIIRGQGIKVLGVYIDAIITDKPVELEGFHSCKEYKGESQKHYYTFEKDPTHYIVGIAGSGKTTEAMKKYSDGLVIVPTVLLMNKWKAYKKNFEVITVAYFIANFNNLYLYNRIIIDEVFSCNLEDINIIATNAYKRHIPLILIGDPYQYCGNNWDKCLECYKGLSPYYKFSYRSKLVNTGLLSNAVIENREYTVHEKKLLIGLIEKLKEMDLVKCYDKYVSGIIRETIREDYEMIDNGAECSQYRCEISKNGYVRNMFYDASKLKITNDSKYYVWSNKTKFAKIDSTRFYATQGSEMAQLKLYKDHLLYSLLDNPRMCYVLLSRLRI